MSQQVHLLSTSEVAERLGWSRAKVKRAAKDGRLPIAGKMPGETGAYLFDSDDIERFAA
jgi:excisionase family DNA binding protein